MHRVIILAAILVGFPALVARAELSPDEIALIVNRNAPDGKILADYYVQIRKLPADRIIEVNLPDADEISIDDYDREVVPVVRKFLVDHKLAQQVKCLVTMYGMPLRLANRKNSPADEKELANLQAALVSMRQQINADISLLERFAVSVDPTYRPGAGAGAGNAADQSIEALSARIDRIQQVVIVAIQRLPDEATRKMKQHQLTELVQRFRTPISTPVSDPATAQTTTQTTTQATTGPSATTEPATEPATQPGATNANMTMLAERNYDPVARAQLRALVARSGSVGFARVLEFQISRFSADATGSALDSELALVWWTNYSRAKWIGNPLSYQYINRVPPPVMMVSRLDAPSPQVVRNLIATSVQVEHDGLEGGIAIDAGGSLTLDPQHKNPAFQRFDDHLGALARWLKQRTRMPVTLDIKAEVFPANSVPDVAVYVGWYSVGKYVPGCLLSRGAVAVHFASYEMTSLHSTNNEGWCRGLLNSGAVATFGSVAEPYLAAFPLPDDFVSILLTGKLTLAEVYWRTNPTVSWQMCLVGDPLYTPYRVKPPVKVSDLPPALAAIFTVRQAPSNPAPSTSPAPLPQR